MTVPFSHSIRLRLLLLIAAPVLLCGLAIAILANTAMGAARELRDLSGRQAELYQGLSLPETLLNRLNDCLSTGEDEEYLAARTALTQSLSQLDETLAGGPYAGSFSRMGQTLLLAADAAVDQRASAGPMLAELRRAEELARLMRSLSPYVQGEAEEVFSARSAEIIDRVSRGVRSDALILAVLLLALIAAAVVIAGSITKPLQLLTGAARSMSLSARGPALPPTERRDELGVLMRAYRDMEERLAGQRRVERQLAEERERHLEAESLLARSELRVYQSQINSHFLFNAFNTVSRLAYIEDAPRVQNAVQLIAQFLRNILTQFDRSVTVEEEFAIVENYTDIQRLRFGDRIKVECTLDAGTEWFVVPALTMQPLVENAYSHGLTDRREGYIRCAAEMDGDDVLLYVWDDGCGISSERQRALCGYVTGQGRDEGISCVGLRNVYRRLALLYPGRVELLLESEEGAYTQIGFVIRPEGFDTPAAD